MADLNLSYFVHRMTRLILSLASLQGGATDESHADIIRQVEEMRDEINRRAAIMERRFAIMRALSVLENLRDIVEEARE
ncbi:77efd688-9f5d-451e-8a1b-51d05ad086d2 [Sclerotinia trifoliorum]|uniref:77efd688-9f5d-451e-8a1b-51d05ad086d2 n=1 Tax=Sclerotinia trifoliorum TaxID=28548 RepID=A0A8H2ZRK9_9HELO|nr:77efd688-9f5d-451e-8a1b-51d05ad086d2 [Sclerotinia trifoliorum]